MRRVAIVCAVLLAAVTTAVPSTAAEVDGRGALGGRSCYTETVYNVTYERCLSIVALDQSTATGTVTLTSTSATPGASSVEVITLNCVDARWEDPPTSSSAAAVIYARGRAQTDTSSYNIRYLTISDDAPDGEGTVDRVLLRNFPSYENPPRPCLAPGPANPNTRIVDASDFTFVRNP